MNYVEVKVPQIHTKKEIIPLLHSIINMADIYIYIEISIDHEILYLDFMLSLSLPYFSKTSLLLLLWNSISKFIGKQMNEGSSKEASM